MIEFRFDYAEPFSGGLAAVLFNRKWGFVDQTGKMAIETDYALPPVAAAKCIWTSPAYFSEGLAAIENSASNEPMYKYIDVSGKYPFEGAYLMAGRFSNGFALVKVRDEKV